MSTQLTPSGVKRALPKLRDHLTPILYRRVEAIADQLQDDGLIRIDDAIAATATTDSPPLKGSAFREFRSTVGKAAAEAGIRFSLEADKRKSEWAYFEGDDPLTAELAARSDKEARAGLPKDVVEADAQVPGPIRVYFSAALQEPSQPSSPASDLIRRVKTELRLTEDNPGFEFASSDDALLGANRKDHLESACSGADVIIVLLSPEYLLPENPEPEIVHHSGKPVVIVSLRSVSAKAEMRELERSHVLWDREPWEEKDNTQRSHSIGDLLAAVKRALSRDKTSPSRPTCTQLLGQHARRTAKGLGAQESQVPLHASRGRFDNTDPGGNYDAEHRLTKNPAEAASEGYTPRHVQAVPTLLEWSKNRAESSPRFAALLGNVGMGKSTALKQLTLQLLDAREQDASLPLPVLFDLRELNGRSVDDMGPSELLDALMKRTHVREGTASGDEVLEVAAQGNCVLLFDGLDEALVHLTEQQGQRLIQRLWQIAGDNPTTRLAISCRTHYFRTLRDEVSTFLSQGRESVNESDYLVLHMLPFTQEQVREYIASNVGAGRVDSIMAMIRSVYNLTELSTQPMLLRMITTALEPLQQRALRGETMRSVDLYESFVSQWLARDDGKHELLPDHKLLLMEDLAAQLWRGGRRTWKVQDLENWMLRFMRNHPDMELHYERRLPGLWKDDLRTATFVTRSGDDYGFAHTSLLEYFLARHLLRLLEAGADVAQADWAELAPSPEAQRFLVEAVLGLSDFDQSTCLATLTALGHRSEALTATLDFASEAISQGLPIRDLSKANATHLILNDLRLETKSTLNMNGTTFTGTSLRRARFNGIDFTESTFSEADLTGAAFVNCIIDRVDLKNANLTGATFRRCILTNIESENAIWSGADLVDTETNFRPNENATLAPDANHAWSPPTSLPGHNNSGRSCAFTYNGGPIITAGTDRNARIWDLATGKCIFILSGHTDWIQSLSCHGDTHTALTTSDDHTARVWDVDSGECICVLVGHTDWVRHGEFSPDGTRIITTSRDGTARVWDTQTGDCLSELKGHKGWVRSGTFSSDGKYALTAGEDHSARLWDANTGTQLMLFEGHKGAVQRCTYSPDGRVYSASADGTMRIWDPQTGKQLHKFPLNTGSLQSISFNSDGTMFSSSNDDKIARIWNVTSGQCMQTFLGHSQGIRDVGHSRDYSRILTTSRDGTARIWDSRTGTCLRVLQHGISVRAGAYSPYDDTCLTIDDDGTARIWDANTGTCTAILDGACPKITEAHFNSAATGILTTPKGNTAFHWDVSTGSLRQSFFDSGGHIASTVYSPSAEFILTAGSDGVARTWDAATGNLLHSFRGHSAKLTGAIFSPDSKRIATTSVDSTARVWDNETGTCIRTIQGHTSAIIDATFSKDGRLLATAGQDSAARIWDIETGECIHVLAEHKRPLFGVEFNGGSDRLLTFGPERVAFVSEVDSGNVLHTLTGHTNAISSGSFSPDGNLILTTSTDRTARLWDSHSGKCVEVLNDHANWVIDGSFSSSGEYFLTASSDLTAKIWHTASRQCLQTLSGHIGAVYGGSFSCDGESVITWSEDGTVRIWDTKTGNQTGIQLDFLPEGEVVVRDGATQEILGASDGAWRWLGITVVQDGRLVRLPAEMGGMLPPLSALGRTPTSPATA